MLPYSITNNITNSHAFFYGPIEALFMAVMLIYKSQNYWLEKPWLIRWNFASLLRQQRELAAKRLIQQNKVETLAWQIESTKVVCLFVF